MENASYAVYITSALALWLLILLLRQETRLEDWGKAAVEVFVVLIISNIAFGFYLAYVALKPDDMDIGSAVRNFYGFGESLVYLSAILAPVLYAVFRNMDGSAKQFFAINIIGILFCLAFAGVLFGQHLFNAPTDQVVFERIGWTLLFVSLTLWFFSRVFENALRNPKPGASAKRRADKIKEELN